MDNLPEGFYLQDIYCYPYDSPRKRRFGYIPNSPSVDSTNGSPNASLLNSSQAAVLSIQTIWTVDDETLSSLQKEIAKRYPGSGKIQLSIGSFSQVDATLIVNNQGTALNFGPKPTSGSQPYRVVFSETLRRAEKQGAIDAFQGQENALMVSYEVAFSLTAKIQVTIQGNIAEDLKALAPKKQSKGWNPFSHHNDDDKGQQVTIEQCRAQVDIALAAGRLTETRDEDPNVSDALRATVEGRVKDRIANDMLTTIQQLGADAGAITSHMVMQIDTGSEQHNYSCTRSLDVGKWFQSYNGPSLIQNSPTSISDPPR